VNRLGSVLARLGGADLDVLEQTRGQRGRFIAMGLVLLSTALLAVLSMTYALVDGLRAPIVGAIALGIVWGAIILNLDRLLIVTMRPSTNRAQIALMVAPRVVMAALLGIVIATPLTLRIFASEIESRMILDNARAAQTQAAARNEDPRYAELDGVKKDIAHYEDVLAGRVSYSSPTLTAARSEYDAAAADLQAKQEAYDKALLVWRCEVYGEQCEGGSGIPGDGARAQAAKEKLDAAAAELAGAQQVMAAKRDALTTAQDEAKTQSKDQLAHDQEEANRVLPTLRQRRDSLEQALASQTDQDSQVLAGNTGLLSRIEALNRLGDESSSARVAHLAVAGLFFMVELLPVMVKGLSMMGAPSQYDRIAELTDKEALDRMAQRRDDLRRRRRKEDEIEDDMLEREVGLGKKANEHVAGEMEKILDVALRDWSKQVARTLPGAVGGHNGSSPLATPSQPPPPRRREP
jgi:hypothetical protein